MKNLFYTYFLLLTSLISFGQSSFEYSNENGKVRNSMQDCVNLVDSTYIGIQVFVDFDNIWGLADSLEIFKLSDKGLFLDSIIVKKDNNTLYSSIYRMLPWPNDLLGRTIVYSSIYDITKEDKEGYIFCVDKDLNILWERRGVNYTGTYEAFSSADVVGENAMLFGSWGGPDENLPFFLSLDIDGNEVRLDTLFGMRNRIEGSDNFIQMGDYYHFFNSHNRVFRLDKNTLDFKDSSLLDLEQMFTSGHAIQLPDNKICMAGKSDTTINFQTFESVSVPTLAFFDEKSEYLGRHRHFGTFDIDATTTWHSAALTMDSSFIYLNGIEQTIAWNPTSDWLTLCKYKVDGSLVWARYYRIGKNFFSNRSRTCQDGGIILTGYSSLNGDWDGLLLKFDSDGNLAGLVNENTPEKQALLSKLHLYPNPTSDWLHLEKETMEETKVQIFNQLGQEVRSFDWNTLEKDISVADLPQGTYFVVVDNGRAQQAVKVLVER